ncbi:MAG: lamin tail domain-containing protein, partial [Chlorobi bacterium]|nr:lamin tail domain-containing protein [Chlorobiota bacterium]
MKIKICILVSLLISSLYGFSQIQDDFDDDEFNSNPTWYGNISGFEVVNPPTTGNGSIDVTALNDNHVLRSKSTQNDVVLTTPSNLAYGEWKFSVADGSGWSISNKNDYFIILISDDSTTTKLKDGASLNFNGYYLRYDGDSSDQFILYKQTGTTEEVVLDTDFPSVVDNTNSPAGYSIKITRDITGLWSVYIDSVFESTATTQRGISVTDNTFQTSQWFGISTNIANASDTRLLYFDNLFIINKDFDTDIQLPTAQITGGTISSLSDTKNEAVSVLKFKITDSGAGDGLPTFINTISIFNSHPANEANWASQLGGIALNDGTSDLLTDSVIISTEKITVYLSPDELTINDGNSKEITFSVYLNTSGIEDGKKLMFFIDADNHNWQADDKGSEILSNFTSDVVSNIFTTDVSGTELLFSNEPDTVNINQNFAITVSSIDENQNEDTDENTLVALSVNNGTGSISSATGLSQNMVNGTISWNDLQYDTLSTFKIVAQAPGYIPDTTQIITSVSDTNSIIENPTVQIPDGTISSLTTVIDSAFPVFKFKITDSGSGDLLATSMSNIVIKNAHPANEASWGNTIAGVLLNNGTNVPINTTVITDEEISISLNEGVLQINDSNSSEVALLIYLKSNNLIDNSVLQFKIDSVNHGLESYSAGSGFSSVFSSPVLSNKISIEVNATKFKIETQPEKVNIYSDFALSFTPTDENDNTDSDYNGNLTLSKYSGIGTLSSGSDLTGTFLNGNVNWTDLQFTTAVEFQIEASSADFTNIITDTIQAILPFYDENFETGNLVGWNDTTDWVAGTTNPINGSYSLKHNLSSVSGQSYISHSLNNVSFNSGTVTWQMVIKNGNWDPTSTNYFGFYLMSDSANFSGDSINAYAIGVNLSGSDDFLKLWKINPGGSYTSLITSNLNWNANDTVSIEVNRTANGLWTLKYALNNAFNNLATVGTASDTNSISSNYYGLLFNYSSTRAGQIWCDDIQIYEKDTPPVISKINVIDSVTLDVIFSEILEQTYAENKANYSIIPQNTSSIVVNSATFDMINKNKVTLSISELVTDNYTLIINNVKDTANLLMLNEMQSFKYIIPPVFGDVVINEIMADPSPVVYLPEYDFVELYNTTNYPVYLEDWTITIGEKQHTFAIDTLPADSFLIVCPSSSVSNFEIYGLTSGILSTSDLTNAGKNIILKNNSGNIISNVFYSDTWYADPQKEEGGWSLEKIDPLNNCSTS